MGAAIAGLWAAGGSDVCITTSHRTDPSEALERVGCDAVRWAASAGEAAQGASFVIEALPEVLRLKQDQLSSAQQASPQALLMTNTSSLRIHDIGLTLQQPERLIGEPISSIRLI